jgi:hypothetical protein
MKKYLLLLISIILCLITLYLINQINPYYVLQENIKEYLYLLVIPIFLSFIVALFVYIKEYYWNRLFPSLIISYLITFVFLGIYFIDSYLDKQKMIENQKLEAQNDIKKGIVKRRIGTGFLIIDENYDKRSNKIDSLERNKYGFFTESTGCMIFEEDSYYNEAIDEYLQKRNGENWEKEYEKDLDLIMKEYPYIEYKK